MKSELEPLELSIQHSDTSNTFSWLLSPESSEGVPPLRAYYKLPPGPLSIFTRGDPTRCWSRSASVWPDLIITNFPQKQKQSPPLYWTHWATTGVPSVCRLAMVDWRRNFLGQMWDVRTSVIEGQQRSVKSDMLTLWSNGIEALCPMMSMRWQTRWKWSRNLRWYQRYRSDISLRKCLTMQI